MINVLLGIIVWAFPEGGISLGRTGQIKFVSFNDLFGKDTTVQAVNLDQVLADLVPLEESDTMQLDTMSSADSMMYAKLQRELNASVHFDSITGKMTTPTERSIQLPPKNPDALKSLIEGLLVDSKKGVVRILHYGDSQLEGDRMTDYVRNRLQSLFGGQGPGIVLPKEPTAGSRNTVRVSHSANIQKKAIYTAKLPAPDDRYGIGGASFVFTGNTSQFTGWDSMPSSKDSGRMLSIPRFDESVQTESYIQIRNATRSYRRCRQYTRVRLLYRSENPFLLTFKSDSFTQRKFVQADTGLAMLEWNRPVTQGVRFDITKGGFPEVYAIALDGDRGVAVDNFPMRGSSAIGFSKMDHDLYAQQLRKMNVKCVIMQYGINVVPMVRSDYSYYQKSLARQIRSIQRALPGVSIIVVGPSDMSTNKAGQMVSYSHITLIRDAMKGAAFETGAAFWDLYEAMGGENSMVSWVDNGLAQKDYTHFSFKGAKYVGEMLFEAILEQLQQYQATKEEEEAKTAAKTEPKVEQVAE